jgi:hypothetical protein
VGGVEHQQLPPSLPLDGGETPRPFSVEQSSGLTTGESLDHVNFKSRSYILRNA